MDLGRVGSAGGGGEMLAVSHGREKVRGSGDQLEQTLGHRPSQHPCLSTELPGASGPHPAPVLTVPVPSEELVAPPCPRQKEVRRPLNAAMWSSTARRRFQTCTCSWRSWGRENLGWCTGYRKKPLAKSGLGNISGHGQLKRSGQLWQSMAGGELFERIVDDDFEHTEPSSAQYMQQILEGLQFMHGQAVVHLDLKPENILCVSPGSHWLKIIDFGLARKLAPDTPVKVLHGTPEFMAPEVVTFEPVGFSTDMWSVGVICYILLSGESPFQGDNDMETLSNVTAAQWDFEEETFSEISQQAKDFISQLLQKDPRCRLSSVQALLHPWLQQPQPNSMKALSKERIKQFLTRRKWQKTGKALLALNRLMLLSQSPERKESGAQDEEDTGCSQAEDQASGSLPQQIPSFSELLTDRGEEEEGGSAAAAREVECQHGCAKPVLDHLE
ncbi:myosin light chain kinase, smooth muscle-like isoform X1 [Falco peregrinus]|uniref:myosin light chain kinase, smooth muscle-like isoform X1 n=1 Tax=Falco peregrinus TaxID=8954 RepID=UPI000FFBD21D|nr:myosin light chain kinase, smooth muscle-like isoform X1 [Falco peregrinus]